MNAIQYVGIYLAIGLVVVFLRGRVMRSILERGGKLKPKAFDMIFGVWLLWPIALPALFHELAFWSRKPKS